MPAIVWIRRSLRRFDNTALVEASKRHDEVIPFYVIDEEYFDKEELGYPRVRFWRESLKQLKQDLQKDGKDLVVRKGKPVKQLEKLVEEVGADAIYYNRDYSPYARERDQKVKELDTWSESFKDIVMFEKEEIMTKKGSPYKVYSYYRDKWFEKEKREPEEPEDFETPNVKSDKIPEVEELGFSKPEGMEWIWQPGRKGGEERLEALEDKVWNYDDKRDLPANNATSRLSPHLKFGTVSVREVFQTVEKLRDGRKDCSGIDTFEEELAWRDFYFQVMYNYPYCVEKPFLEQYESIDWRSKKEAEEDWRRFIEGRTGFPFVDAGMRELRRKGWMHNRLRMVVTSFAAKDLHLDWELLHSYFKRMFVDAELSAMIGGIQWAYSIGTDAQPYFRVFNPWTQGEKFDPDGEYIRENVPELSEVPDQYIHQPQKMPEGVQKESNCIIGEDYPEPIVDHDEERKKAVEMFEEARED